MGVSDHIPAGSPAPMSSAEVAPADGLEGEIRLLLLEVLAARVESADADLLEAGIFDSMGLVQFILALENRYGLKITLDEIDADSIRSVTRIVELIQSRGGKDQAQPSSPEFHGRQIPDAAS